MTSVAPRRRASDRPPEPLLSTKLFLPRRRNGLVPRRRLLELLGRDETTRLTLVDAPPGWGKTTLLAQWSEERPGQVAWVALDSEDNDPTRFWSYLITAIGDIHANLARDDLLASVRLHGVDVLRDVVPVLIENLSAASSDIFVVLDDYHVLTNSDVHAGVAGLITALPDHVHFIVASRSDPPLGLARLRARGELTEIRADHLRFTEDETAHLVNGTTGGLLTAADVTRLQERTEGWAAGLQLAALTLRDRPDVSAFLDEFTGDDRHVVDYLVAEVLDGLPHELRAFMLSSSVLPRMSGPLCDATLETQASSERLADIERRGLFLVPLDRNRSWYRYHHLFGELLRHELTATTPELVPELHARAARWWENQGDIAAAVQHTDAAGDVEQTRHLVRTHWRTLFNQGLLTTVERWIALLPKTTVIADEQLSEAAIWTALDRGQLGHAEDWLTHVQHLGDGTHLALLRALHAFKRGDLGKSRQLLAAEGEPVTDEFARVVRLCLEGITAYWSADYSAAAGTLAAAATAAELSGNALAETYARGYRALALLRLGALDRADYEVAAASDTSPDPAVRAHFVSMAPALARAELADLRDDTASAVQHAVAAVELAGRGAGLLELTASLSCAAHLQRVTGDRAAADRLAAEAAANLARCADPGPLLGRPAARVIPAPRRGEVVEPLTDRELAIVRMLPGDATNRELAAALYVSPNTLKTHLRAIYRKIGVATRSEAVARARELGLLPAHAR